MTAKSRKRAKRRNLVSLANGETAPLRPHPKDRTRTNQPAEDARKVAKEARLRVHRTPKGEELNPMAGCTVGRAIMAEPKEHHADLWNAAQHARKTQLAYDKAIGAPARHPVVARMLAPMATASDFAASPAPDLRSEEERYACALRDMNLVGFWLWGLPFGAFRQVVIDNPDGPTQDWPAVKACLWAIARGLKGEANT